jgi:hypothetical protein
MSRLPNHLFSSESTGGLYDTRFRDYANKPIRENYDKPHTTIDSVADLKAALRYGGYAWHGGYPLFFITYDGETISFEGARKEFRSIISDIATGSKSRIVYCRANYEESDLVCEITGKPIQSAYGDSDTDSDSEY